MRWEPERPANGCHVQREQREADFYMHNLPLRTENAGDYFDERGLPRRLDSCDRVELEEASRPVVGAIMAVVLFAVLATMAVFLAIGLAELSQWIGTQL